MNYSKMEVAKRGNAESGPATKAVAGTGTAAPTDSPPTVESTAQLVVAVVPRAMRQIRTVARSRSSSLSVPQFRTLGYLRRHPDAGLTALADHLGVSLPAASALVSRLVDAGLVERSTDPAERRRVHLRLSPAGRERVAASQLAVGAWWVDRLAALSPDDLARLTDGLERLDAVLSDEAPRTLEEG